MTNTIIYGWHTVNAMLEQTPAGIKRLWLLDKQTPNKRQRAILANAERYAITLHYAGRAELDTLTGYARHQGVVAECITTEKGYAEADLITLIDNSSTPPLLLVLDGIQDPHNLGACLRTADGAGVNAVIAPMNGAVGLTPTVHKVASGASANIPYIQVANLARTLRRLQQQGVWLIGASDDADNAYDEIDMTGPCTLIMGAEGKGLRRLTRQHCDHLVQIPMVGSVSSLNVSVATGVILFEAVRQRRHANSASVSESAITTLATS